ncbi:hypothetical protein B0H14DRAFT_3490641 [Mycena olivaceomarginata]|nr:hypothetical protein B0H14DRAFT_3490641 [Mycena olivaceomarginata]
MSHPADVLVIRLTASEPGRPLLQRIIHYTDGRPFHVCGRSDARAYRWKLSRPPSCPPLASLMKIDCSSSLLADPLSVVNSATNSYLSVSNATSATLFVAIATSYNATAAVLPTDVRAGLFQHIFDPGFLGRRASSKSPGYFGTNFLLQTGTANSRRIFNLEMNYWGAEVANLADLVEPLIRLIEDVAVTGARTAQVMYQCFNNRRKHWRWSRNGAPWRIYPLFRGASQFFLETLQVHPNHTDWLVVNPSLSPEHGFGNINDENTSINLGVTMDNSLLRDLFRETATLANVLGVDDDLVAQLTSTAAKLPPFLVGAGGQLQEWLTWSTGLRACRLTPISPLYGLFREIKLALAKPDAIERRPKRC